MPVTKSDQPAAERAAKRAGETPAGPRLGHYMVMPFHSNDGHSEWTLPTSQTSAPNPRQNDAKPVKLRYLHLARIIFPRQLIWQEIPVCFLLAVGIAQFANHPCTGPPILGRHNSRNLFGGN